MRPDQADRNIAFSPADVCTRKTTSKGSRRGQLHRLRQPGKAVHDLAEQGDFGSGVKGLVGVINNGEGPRVLVVAGVHGDEYEAQLCLHALLAQTRPEDVTGRLVIVPEANFPASGAGRRVAPVDGANMNRTFPGSQNGTPTEHLSASLFEAVAHGCDLVIDVHAGGPTYEGGLIAFGFPAADRAEDVVRSGSI